MDEIHYIGFDVHKKTIQYCIKRADGTRVQEGRIAATHAALAEWAAQRTVPWKGALEATMFSGWIYDALAPHALELKVAHSALLQAIAAGKHASDRLDAATICDLARANLIRGVWMAPPELRALRTLLRFRALLVRQATQTKNRLAATLMERGVEYSKSRLHGRDYFEQLLAGLQQQPAGVRTVLRLGRGGVAQLQRLQGLILKSLETHPQLAERVRLLRTIPGVGLVTALTWALEIGDPQRLASAGRAMSYCGLVAPLQESAGKKYRQPLSKKRNPHLQTVLIEAAHLAVRYHAGLRRLYDQTKQRKHSGAAALAVARKLVSYLLWVDRHRQPFQMPPPPPEQAPGAASAQTAAGSAQPLHSAPPTAVAVPQPAAAPLAPAPDSAAQTATAPPAPALSLPPGTTTAPPAPPIGHAALARRSSPSRVRSAAAAAPAAPWTAAGRRAQKPVKMGGAARPAPRPLG